VEATEPRADRPGLGRFEGWSEPAVHPLEFRIVAEPESFFVLDTGGPLKEGELERAAYWAEGLVASVADADSRGTYVAT